MKTMVDKSFKFVDCIWSEYMQRNVEDVRDVYELVCMTSLLRILDDDEPGQHLGSLDFESSHHI